MSNLLNPIVLQNKDNLVYWHRQVVHYKHLKQASDDKIVIEIDLSFDEKNKKPYIGHSKNIYNLFFDKIFIGDSSKNISFGELVDYIHKNKLFVIFDCKNRNVLKYIKDNFNKFNFNNIIFHAFIEEWCFDKRNRRHQECIKLKDIHEFKESTHTFWIGSSLVQNYNQVDSDIIKTVTDTGNSIIDGISFFTNYYQLLFPKLSIYKIINEKGYVPVFASDFVLIKPSFKYIGASNFLNRCTKINDEK